MVQTLAVPDAVMNETMFGYLLEDIDTLAIEPPGWWHPRAKLVESWLKHGANRSEIPDDGSEEMIRRHVQRGDIYPHVQLKCWRHILLELQDIPCFATRYADCARAAVANASPSRGKIRPGKELIILSDDTPNQESAASSELASNESASERSSRQRPRTAAASGGTAPSDGAKKFSALSMAERQTEWLRKKQEKMEVKRSRQEEEKDKELTFQPKILRRATLGDRPSKDPSAQRVLQRSDTGGSGSSRKLDISGGGGESAKPSAGPKEKAIPRVPPRSAGRRKKMQQVAPSQPIEISSDLLNSMKSELTASLSKNVALSPRVASRNSDTTTQNDPSQDDSDVGGSDDAVVEEAASSETQLSLKSWSDQPVIGGRRVDFDSSETKARLVLQDASKFELSSMYRKTDKKAKRDGVALHVGRREDTFDEEVIAVLFDKEKVSELEAARWWFDHEHRFAHFIRELPPPIDFSS